MYMSEEMNLIVVDVQEGGPRVNTTRLAQAINAAPRVLFITDKIMTSNSTLPPDELLREFEGEELPPHVYYVEKTYGGFLRFAVDINAEVHLAEMGFALRRGYPTPDTDYRCLEVVAQEFFEGDMGKLREQLVGDELVEGLPESIFAGVRDRVVKLAGGAMGECLDEVTVWLNILGIEHETDWDLIY